MGGAEVKDKLGLDVFDLSLWEPKNTTVWAKVAVSGEALDFIGVHNRLFGVA